MKTIINEKQKALIYINGALNSVQGAGAVRTGGRRTAEILPIDGELMPQGCTPERIAQLDEKLVTLVNVEQGKLCLHYVDGAFAGLLTAGRHAFWSEWGRHEFRMESALTPEIPEDIAQTVLRLIPREHYTVVTVNDYEAARLCCDGKFVRLLGAGTYCFWTDAVNVTAQLVDLREQAAPMPAQEILTADKVGLRVTFALFFRITDPADVDCAFDKLVQKLYLHAQLALRESVSRYKMDEILDDKDKISLEAEQALRARAAGMPVEITSAGIRDIILPGKIADIMNSVLEAEKRAQANAITRREETAATRSLLNTAKLLDENATLRRLKELEYVERICAGIGSISVDGRSGLVSQLAEIFTGEKTSP